MNRPGTSISKSKTTKQSLSDDANMKKVPQEKMPTLQDYLTLRDWIGAIGLLENERNVNIQVENSMWLTYCYFHMGEYRYNP
jgi:intraflagellar transport protein 56